MTGYFRDDGPLYELMLDERGQARARSALAGVRLHHRRPDAAVFELPLVRARRDRLPAGRRGVQLRPRRGQGRGVRGQDGAVRGGLPGEGPAARGERPGDPARSRTSSGSSPRRSAASSGSGAEAEPRHVEALQRFAERAYRRPLVGRGAPGRGRLLPGPARGGRAGPRGRRPRHGRRASSCRPTSATGSTCPGGRPGVRPLSDYDLASRLSYFLWASMPDEELLAHAAAGDLHEPDGARGPGPADAPRRPRARAGHGVRRQLARLPPVRGAQQRRPRPVPGVQRRAAAVDVRGADPVLRGPRPRTTGR